MLTPGGTADGGHERRRGARPRSGCICFSSAAAFGAEEEENANIQRSTARGGEAVTALRSFKTSPPAEAFFICLCFSPQSCPIEV